MKVMPPGMTPQRKERMLKLARIALALISVHAMTPRGFGATAALRVELNTNTVCLVVSPISTPGTLFVFAAVDLPTLGTTPHLMLQTNTPLTGELRLPLPLADGFTKQGFFRAAHWDGLAPALLDIPAGTFVMGSPLSEPEQSAWEGPQTTVTITYSFRIGKYEITQAEYQAIMGNNPSYFSGTFNRPVEQVSWNDAVDYCSRLTEAQRLAGCLPAGWAYRLPTEAEWEYACRAGTTTAFTCGPTLQSGLANFDGRREYDATVGTVSNPGGVVVDKTVAVGSYSSNAWGLCDMHGNVWEWCADWWQYNLSGGSVTNPQGASSGSERVVRGGCWYNDARVCRSGYRIRGRPDYRGNEIGFRVVLARINP